MELDDLLEERARLSAQRMAVLTAMAPPVEASDLGPEGREELRVAVEQALDERQLTAWPGLGHTPLAPDDLAEIEHQQALHHRGERVQDMLDPDDRHALRVDVPDGTDQRLALGLGQAACDFVQQ